MLGLVLNGINWQTGMQLLLLMFAAVTLGGLGTAFGALIGSLIIGMTVELANFVVPGDFKYATALLLLIVILLVRPQGIFGRKERIG
jgi:branched-chain amino acid transport system permease protein